MSERINGHTLRANASTFNPEAREFIPSGFGKNILANDIDARCGEVVEILEDAIGDDNLQDDDFDGQLNDDELLEMLEMQEECRREMIKTYVQANNPTMFEEIYYNVSYPDESIIPMQPPNVSNYQQQQQQDGVVLDTFNNLNINDNQHEQQQQQLSALELIKTNLNPNAHEFIPKNI